MSELISTTMSLIKTRKSKGPRIEPWGTPALVHLHSEDTASQIGFDPLKKVAFNTKLFQFVK